MSADEPPPALRDALAPRFEWLATLGAGAHGWVGACLERALGRKVALKLGKHASDPQRLARFEREARIAAGLRHPNVVAVHSMGVAQDRPYLVLDLVEGARTLRELMRDAPLPQQLDALVGVVRGVAHAHAQGVTHRDLKPENVLVDPRGVARVTDFGSATMQGVSRLTQSGALVGTPVYMAPEQIGGQRERVGSGSDVWALGVMLHEVAAGRLPFGGGTFLELVSEIRQGVSSVALLPGVPRRLGPVIARCLHPAPGARYPDAQALLAALDAAQLSTASGEDAAGAPGRGALVLAVGFGLALVLGAALGVRAVLAPEGPPEALPPEPPRVAAEVDPRAEWARVQREASADGLLSGGEAWLARFGAHPLAAEVRDALVARRKASPRWVLALDAQRVPEAVASEDGLYCLYGGPRSRRLERRSWGRWEPEPCAVPPVLLHVAGAPAHRGVWYGELLDLQTQRVRYVDDPRAPEARIVAEDWAEVRGTATLECAADGRALLALQGQDWWHVVEREGRASLVTQGRHPFPLGFVRSVALCPDGQRAVFAGRDTTERSSADVLRVQRLRDHELLAERMLTAQVSGLLPLTEERLLVATRVGQLIEFDLGFSELVLYRNPGVAPIEFVGPRAIPGELRALRLAATGRVYAQGELDDEAGGRLQVWDPRSRGLVTDEPFPVYRDLQVDPSGRWLVGTRQGAVEVWDRWVPGEWTPGG